MSNSTLIEMDIRRKQLACRRERDPRVTMTKIIFLHSPSMTVDECIKELMIDLVPRFIAEDLANEWAMDKAGIRRII